MKTILKLTLSGLHHVSRGLLASQGYLSPAQLQALEQSTPTPAATRTVRANTTAGKAGLASACCA